MHPLPARLRHPPRAPAARAGGWPAALGGLALLAAIALLAWAAVSGAPAVPFSDEAGHVDKALWLRTVTRGASLSSFLPGLLRPTDSYPDLFHLVAQLPMAWIPGLLGVRAGAVLFVLLHAAAAVALGPRLWGWPATWTYVALACGGPVVLSMSTLAFVDGPSAAMTGLAVLLLLKSEGFRRPGATMAFALAAAAALYTKWIVLVFLAPVVGWALVQSLAATTRRPALRLGLGLALVALGAALAAATWFAGADPAIAAAVRDGHRPWAFQGPLLAGLALAGLVATAGLARPRHPLPPALLAGLALVVIVLVAGPWYVGAHQDLVDRLGHESGQLAMRGSSPIPGRASLPRALLASLGDVVPAVTLALVPGLLLALRQPTALLQSLSCLASGLLGTGLVLATLPPDLRYLLPAAPLLAAAAARALGTAPLALALPLSAGVVAAQLGTSAPMLAPSAPGLSRPSGPGGASIDRRLAPPWPALPLGRVQLPDPLGPEQVAALLHALEEGGAGRAHPVLVLESEEQPLQGRAVRVLARLQGGHVGAEDGRWAEPLPPVAPDQLVLAPACDREGDPTPVARFARRQGPCDLGLYQGVVPRPPPR